MTFIFLMSSLTPQIIYDFSTKSAKSDWVIVDDGVMGGKSKGSFEINSDGEGVFSGIISLENYGGFSSVRHRLNNLSVNHSNSIRIKLKGDGKKYQFRIKANPTDYYSYITTFQTSGQWQGITIALNEFYPSFRGRTLDMPNFSNKSISEITFLIANKKNENFKLIIDKIELI